LFYSDGKAHGIVQGNVFRSNIAKGGSNPDAGGLMIYLLGNGSTATVENNTFTGNHAGLGGGGCFIRMNESSCTVTALNNRFSDNRTFTGSGAGMLVYMNNGVLTYSGNVHTENRSAEDGGGAWLNVLSGSATIFGNTFASNACVQNGGGLSFTSDTAEVGISRNIFYTNTAGNAGGGLSCATNSGYLKILNNTTCNNSASADGGGMYLYMDQDSAQLFLKNNILWSESPNGLGYSFGSGNGTVTMTYSCVWNGLGEPWFGGGCISENPLFVNAAEGDFRLQWTNYPISDSTKSPCIDTGDPTSPKDSDNTRADMGALAFTTMPGDVNADNLVDLKDAVLVFQVLSTGAGQSVHLHADVNGNQKTDLSEAIYILQKIAGIR
jgi:hypothetical protein